MMSFGGILQLKTGRKKGKSRNRGDGLNKNASDDGEGKDMPSLVDSSDEEDILDDDPSSESRDSYSYRRTRAYSGDKESCEGEEESY